MRVEAATCCRSVPRGLPSAVRRTWIPILRSVCTWPRRQQRIVTVDKPLHACGRKKTIAPHAQAAETASLCQVSSPSYCASHVGLNDRAMQRGLKRNVQDANSLLLVLVLLLVESGSESQATRYPGTAYPGTTPDNIEPGSLAHRQARHLDAVHFPIVYPYLGAGSAALLPGYYYNYWIRMKKGWWTFLLCLCNNKAALYNYYYSARRPG
eukprot:477086-Rhodomonas_salina.1